jgi:hypothetical protein
MPSLKHIHILERLPTGAQFKCKDPHCSWRDATSAMRNKEVRCYRCLQPFIPNAAQFRLVSPHCGCNKRAVLPPQEVQEVALSIFEDLFKSE